MFHKMVLDEIRMLRVGGSWQGKPEWNRRGKHGGTENRSMLQKDYKRVGNPEMWGRGKQTLVNRVSTYLSSIIVHVQIRYIPDVESVEPPRERSFLIPWNICYKLSSGVFSGYIHSPWFQNRKNRSIYRRRIHCDTRCVERFTKCIWWSKLEVLLGYSLYDNKGNLSNP